MCTQPMVMLRVLDARPEDVPEVVRMGAQLSPDELTALARRHGGFMVAKDITNGHVVGFVVVRRGQALDAHLDALDVEPLHRGRGIGDALLRKAVNRMASEGARTMDLEVAVDAVDAQAFYQRHGFQPHGLVEHALPDGKDAVLLGRPL